MKSALKSKTIWGVLIAAGAAAGLPGLAAPADDASTVDSVVHVLGLLLALYGRFKASGGISLLPAKGVPPAP